MVDHLKSPTILDIAQMIDISAVRAENTDLHIRETVDRANQYSFYLVTVLPAQTARARDLIAGNPTPKLGGNVGFPSGGQTTSIKVAETREFVEMHVDEIDMVINIGAHLSGRYVDVYRDIAAVVEAAENKPVKVILECYYLSDDQIRIGCDLAIQSGAAYVKTGTGWTPTSATLENVTLIKKHVGDAIQIKASGGIRGVETLLEMHRRGASRFGISLTYASKIFETLECLG
jgi:deoxyribose-phosphate aldolase